MSGATVSLVIVSQDRPAELALCLTGVAQLDWPALEVVVVACPAGVAAAQARPEGTRIKTVELHARNISAARNRGIAAAAGDIVAFIDDDAVPEASWLRHLIAPFRDPAIAAAGGTVLGRNGISVQWGPRRVDASGRAVPLRLEGNGPVVLTGRPGRAIKTEGTNMAVRREVLVDLGGFDAAFRFYLDETDLNLRLAERGLATALVPRAVVHHGYAASPRRAADRTPRDLTEIGASYAVFLRKHMPASTAQAGLIAAFRTEQRGRLLRAMQRGPLDPVELRAILRGLDRGLAEGARRSFGQPATLPRAERGFLAFPTRPEAPHAVFSGRGWSRAALDRAARAAVEAGATATVFRFGPGARAHRMRFVAGGWWEQTGGLFGRSDRDGPRFRLTSFGARVRREAERLSPVRRTDGAKPPQGRRS